MIMLSSCRVTVVVWSVLCAASSAHAQKLPVPGQKNPDWSLQKTEEMYPSEPTTEKNQTIYSMPIMPREGYGGMKNQNGEWEILYDSKHQVRYNMKAYKRGFVRVQNLQTGTVYTYTRKGSVAPNNQK